MKNSKIIIGSKCKKFRESHLKLSLVQVAGLINVQPITVQRFEDGVCHSTKILDWYLEQGCEVFK